MVRALCWRPIIISVSLVFLTMLFPALVLAHPAADGSVSHRSASQTIPPLGGTDLNGYCKSLGYQGVSRDGNDAYGWRCVTQSGEHVGLSVLAACQWQYNDKGAIDVFLNFYDPNSWKCWIGIRNLGGTDLDGYCKSLGYQGASRDGNNAYSWRCVTQSGDHISLSVWDACQWQYKGETERIARVGNFYDPNSWQCWKSAYTDNTTHVWAGYALSGTTDHPVFYDVRGAWTVPAASNCSFLKESQSAMWVGLSGNNSGSPGNDNLAQIGTESACTKSSLPIYIAVYQMYPAIHPAQQITEGCSDSDYNNCKKVNVTVDAGDQVVAEVGYLGKGKFKLYIDDKTQKWHSGLPLQSQPGSDLQAARSHAEWIVESPVNNLTNFGTTHLSGCLVDNMSISDGSIITKYVMLSKDNTTVMAEPLGLTNNGSAFDVQWFSSGP